MNWRQGNKTVQFGKLTHYIPENGVYVYFRHDDKGSVMVMLNNTNEDKEVDLTRFAENIEGFKTGKSVLDKLYFDQLNKITIPAKSPLVIELME